MVQIHFLGFFQGKGLVGQHAEVEKFGVGASLLRKLPHRFFHKVDDLGIGGSLHVRLELLGVGRLLVGILSL